MPSRCTNSSPPVEHTPASPRHILTPQGHTILPRPPRLLFFAEPRAERGTLPPTIVPTSNRTKSVYVDTLSVHLSTLCPRGHFCTVCPRGHFLSMWTLAFCPRGQRWTKKCPRGQKVDALSVHVECLRGHFRALSNRQQTVSEGGLVETGCNQVPRDWIKGIWDQKTIRNGTS